MFKSLPQWKRIACVLGLVLVAFVALSAESCDPSSQPNQQQVDQQNNNDAAARLHQAEPYPVLKDSEELWNQRQWYLRLNDHNKVAYVYLINMGKIFAEYQVIGKCSSTESQYSAPAQVEYHTSANGGNVVLPAAQPDGSYGQNENAIFCFIDNAQRTMIEFDIQHIWSETPLALTTPPDIIITPNGK